jgi:hypothetical protein
MDEAEPKKRIRSKTIEDLQWGADGGNSRMPPRVAPPSAQPQDPETPVFEPAMQPPPSTLTDSDGNPVAPPAVITGPLKGSAFLAEERRRRVYEFLIRGVPVTTMARILRVSRETIHQDIKFIRNFNKQRIVNSDPAEEIGDHDRFLNEIEVMALYEYHGLPDERDDMPVFNPDGSPRLAPDGTPVTKRVLVRSHAASRSRFLELALRARESRLSMQMRTGVVPKAPEQLNLGFNVEGEDIRTISDPERLKQLRQRLIERLQARQTMTPSALPRPVVEVDGDDGTEGTGTDGD